MYERINVLWLMFMGQHCKGCMGNIVWANVAAAAYNAPAVYQQHKEPYITLLHWETGSRMKYTVSRYETPKFSKFC